MAYSGWRDRLRHNKRELNTGRYSTYLCKYICSYFSLSLSSSSIAISHGYYRPAQPVRPLCEHSGVKVEKEREFDRQKERERETGKAGSGGLWIRQLETTPSAPSFEQNPPCLSICTLDMKLLWTHCAKFNHTGANPHCHTVHSRPTHSQIHKVLHFLQLFCTYLKFFCFVFLWKM